jgi:hypothetical protein
MKKSFTKNMTEINENIAYVEKMLKEAMSFCEEDDMEMPMDGEMGMEPEMPMDNEMDPQAEGAVNSYIDHIRKYSINALSELSDNPESEEYQMMKKIFQMCDKKPEKKEGMNESHRVFGIHKGNKKVLFEAKIENPKNFKNFQKTLAEQARRRGVNPADIRLVSENKIIR